MSAKQSPTSSGLWKETVFADSVSTRDVQPLRRFTPSLKGFDTVVDSIWQQYAAVDTTFAKTLSNEAFKYYATSVTWMYLTKYKETIGDPLNFVESQLTHAMRQLNVMIPEPLLALLQAIGQVTEVGGHTLTPEFPPLPNSLGTDATSGFYNNTINTANHTLFEEIPCVGTALTMVNASKDANNFGQLPPYPVNMGNGAGAPNSNIVAYGQVRNADQLAVATTVSLFTNALTPPGTVDNTGISIAVINNISTKISAAKTIFSLSPFTDDTPTRVGQPALMLRQMQDDQADPNSIRNSTITVQGLNREADTQYGLSAYGVYGYVRPIDAAVNDNNTWACADAPIPAAWVGNANARRLGAPWDYNSFRVDFINHEAYVTNVVKGYSKPP
jgi:hypothetical protein